MANLVKQYYIAFVEARPSLFGVRVKATGDTMDSFGEEK